MSDSSVTNERLPIMANAATTDETTIDAEIVDGAENADEASRNNAVGATDVVKAIQGLNNPDAAFYSSIKTTDFDSQLAIVEALTNSTPVEDILGQEIDLKDFIVLPVDLENQQTGETTTQPRVILISADGAAYNATSIGLLTALRNLTSVVKEPADWPKPIRIKFVQQKGNNGYKFFTFKVVRSAS